MSSEKVFRDPVHNLIAVPDEDSFIFDLLGTPEVQRLRRIRQLGVSLFTYQGAEHSRFTHSIGVYYCVSRILDALQRNHQGDADITGTIEQIRKPVKAAALLHDLGHGPFSHVFERFSDRKHEDITLDIIRNDGSGVNRELLRSGIDPEDVANIINKTYRPSLAIDIISSELDADRMDYLLRDSLMCGVTYGNFDFEWMMHIMHASDISGEGDSKVTKLTADATKGTRAIEQYVLARTHMYEQVYFHKTTRGIEGLLMKVLECARALISEREWEPPNADPVVMKIIRGGEHVSIADYLLVDDFAILRAVTQWSEISSGDPHEAELASLSRKFLNRARPFGCIDVTDKLVELGELKGDLKHQRPDLHHHWFVDDLDSSVYKGVLYNLRKEKSPEEEANSTIYVMTSRGPSPIEAESNILKDLSGTKFQRMRLYYDRDMREEFEPMFAKYGIIR